MNIDDDYKRELNKYLEDRKPKSFGSMIESMSWYTKTMKEFKEKVEKGEIKIEKKS